MDSHSRRNFIVTATAAGTALLITRLTGAAAPAPLLQETDPQAVALGYKADASKVDKVKFPRYAAGQMCANCTLYQGKPSDPSGLCPLFQGKQVAAKAWCSAWSKKA
jgi:hypothetical protein